MNPQASPSTVRETAKESSVAKPVARKNRAVRQRPPKIDEPGYDEYYSDEAIIARVVDRILKNPKPLRMEGKTRAELTAIVQKSEDEYWESVVERIRENDKKTKPLTPEEKRAAIEESRALFKENGFD